ncbi:Hypothetical protein mma_2217 [Janthinobacterium sp. Marseille]|nr:toxin YdaT family protein [Janthinobacterium sp. Marseille]ABR91439.1 Hypothetical protein mma_2217 [Janthinobacterium sp. Marseille]
MKNELHKTWIGIVREHVIAWRKAEGWSRETVTQVIVEMHGLVGGVTGIVFEKNPSDPFTERETNAQRLFRWLDDESKSTNLLPMCMTPSILLAMPMERRFACASELMVSVGLGACPPSDAEEGELSLYDVFATQRDDLDANQAVLAAVQDPTPENLEIADRKLLRAQKRKERLQKMIAFARKVGGVLGRFTHPKKEAA